MYTDRRGRGRARGHGAAALLTDDNAHRTRCASDRDDCWLLRRLSATTRLTVHGDHAQTLESDN